MVTCPHCKQQAMSQLRKSFLGPVFSTSCQSCGKRVSVSWAALLAPVPFLLSMALAFWLWPSPSALVLPVVGIAAMFVIHAKLVPLVPRGT